MKVRITLDNGDFIEQSFGSIDDLATEMAHWSWCFKVMGERRAIEHLKAATNHANRLLEKEVPAERV